MPDYNDALVAAATTSSAGAISGETVGFSAAPVLAASVYTYTLGPSHLLDPENSSVHAVITGATAGMITATHTADNTVVVRTFDAAGVAADRAHIVEVRRKAVG